MSTNETYRYRKRRSGEDDAGQFQWGGALVDRGERAKRTQPAPDREKPSFLASGLLSIEQRTHELCGVEMQYEPPYDERSADMDWRIYVFKGDDIVTDGGIVHLRGRGRVLLGRDRRVADIPTDHASCSKQHAVIQFRVGKSENGRPEPWIMDLDTTNGTFLNGSRIDGRRYYQLFEGDVITLGSSTRDYVLLCGDGEGQRGRGGEVTGLVPTKSS